MMEACPFFNTEASEKFCRTRAAIDCGFVFQWSPARYTTRNIAPGFKSYNFNGPQHAKSSYDSPGSFTRSTPGRSNLYTDFSR